jgi:hypothetical protein
MDYGLYQDDDGCVLCGSAHHAPEDCPQVATGPRPANVVNHADPDENGSCVSGVPMFTSAFRLISAYTGAVV